MKEITSNIYYVGVNDRNKNLFEGLWPLPKGVSYNSYLIVDEKVCLVDTCLLYTSPSPRDFRRSRMPSSA